MSKKKLIRISHEGTVSTHAFPSGNTREVSDSLREMIGNGCELIEHVRPSRLYGLMGCSCMVNDDTYACMLVDEEFLVKDGPKHPNRIASFLYGTDLHGSPICGNVLIVGTKRDPYGGFRFDGLETETFDRLRYLFRCMQEELQKGQKDG